MSESTERRNRAAWRPLAVAVAGGALLVTTGFGVWAALNATAFNTTPQVTTSGTLKLNLADNGKGFTTAVSNLAPGDVVDRYVDVTNNGSLDAQGLTLGIAASPNNNLVTDSGTAKGLRVTISSCSTSWTIAAGTCSGSGTVTTLLASTPISSVTAAAPASLVSGAIASGAVNHLKVALTLPDQSETTVNGAIPANTIQGLTTSLTYTFTESQRTATTTDS